MTDYKKELKAVARFLNVENATGDEIVLAIKKTVGEAFAKGMDATGREKQQEYRHAVLATESKDFKAIAERLDNYHLIRLLHGGIGMATEAAELLDALKKHIFYGVDLDKTNIKEEIGDSDWYRELLLHVFGWTDEDIKDVNIQKLKRRYPEGFSAVSAINRDLEAEREILEGKGDGKEEKAGN